MQQITQVFNSLTDATFYLKFSKCHFFKTSIEYLGHIITTQGVKSDPSKIEAMLQWSIPISLEQLRGYLGLTNFYRRFIKNYASLSFDLMELLKEGAFQWHPYAQKSFDALKETLTKAPVLALPHLQNLLQTNASGTRMGAFFNTKWTINFIF